MTAAWIAIVLGAGVVAAVTWQPAEPSVATLLARVDRFFTHTKGYRFDGRGEQATTTGSRHVTNSYTVSGAVSADQSMRLLVITDDLSTEIISSKDRAAVRTAERADELLNVKWQLLDDAGEFPVGGVTVRSGDVAKSILAGHLGEMARQPAVIGRDKGQPVVRFHIDPTSGDGYQVLSSEAELTVKTDGTPQRLVTRSSIRFEFEDPVTVEMSDDYRLSDWGKAVEVSFPGDADIDQTPDIDEELIAAYHDAPLLQPRAVPAGWELDYATVLGKDETAEGCPEVELDYIDPDDPDVGYLYLYELAASCADSAPPRGAKAFRAGAYQGWIDVDDDDGTTAQIIAGRTAIQVETDLASQALSRVLADLVPLDLTKPPATLPQ